MEQVEPGPSRWRHRAGQWLWVLLVFVGIGAVLGAALLRWAAAALLATPLVAIALLVQVLLPGFALLRLLWPRTADLLEQWPLAAALSIGVPPIVLLLCDVVGLRWGGWQSWLFLAICAAVVVWPRRDGSRRYVLWAVRSLLVPDQLLLVLLTVLAVLVRLYATRELLVGSFGDSYHHTLIAQLLVDHGGLFSSWQPYAPLRTFTYHFGFHSNVAWLHWLSGTAVAEAVIVVGQILNALVVPTTFALTRRLTGDSRAALWAAVIAGFVSVLPAYYVNWGRYTQLAGQTELAGVALVWLALIDSAVMGRLRSRSGIGLVVLAGLATAGILLTHYRIAVFAAGLILAYSLIVLIVNRPVPRNTITAEARNSRIQTVVQMALAGGVATLLALLLFAPWAMRLRASKMARIGQALAGSTIGAEQFNNALPLSVVLSFHAKYYLVVLALLGLLALLWRRNNGGAVIGLWALLVWLLANPHMLGLFGTGIIDNFSVLLANYLVLAPLGGYGLALICAGLGRSVEQGAQRAGLLQPRFARHLDHPQRRWWQQPTTLFSILLGAFVVAWGLSWQRQIAEPQFQLFTAADAEAMTWIVQHVPPDDKIFVNGLSSYGGTVYAGSDGGWWIPYESGRQTNIPPYVQGVEEGEQPNYQQHVTAENDRIMHLPISSAAAAEALRAAGYDYLYNGPADTTPSGEYISTQAIGSSPLYRQVYQRDGVTIWQIVGATN